MGKVICYFQVIVCAVVNIKLLKKIPFAMLGFTFIFKY